jgi:hypothetical protein
MTTLKSGNGQLWLTQSIILLNRNSLGTKGNNTTATNMVTIAADIAMTSCSNTLIVAMNTLVIDISMSWGSLLNSKV